MAKSTGIKYWEIRIGTKPTNIIRAKGAAIYDERHYLRYTEYFTGAEVIKFLPGISQISSTPVYKSNEVFAHDEQRSEG